LRSPLTGRRKAAVEVLLKERMPLATESRFYFRDTSVTAALPQHIYGETGTQAKRKLASLKALIVAEQARRGLPAPVTYSAIAETLQDGWTMVGNKGGFMAQHEHTIVVTDDKPIILTAMNEIWN